MVLTVSDESVIAIDRRTRSLLLATAEHAKASAELFRQVAETLADGVLTPIEQQRLRVECMHLRSIVVQVEAVIR